MDGSPECRTREDTIDIAVRKILNNTQHVRLLRKSISPKRYLLHLERQRNAVCREVDLPWRADVIYQVLVWPFARRDVL